MPMTIFLKIKWNVWPKKFVTNHYGLFSKLGLYLRKIISRIIFAKKVWNDTFWSIFHGQNYIFKKNFKAKFLTKNFQTNHLLIYLAFNLEGSRRTAKVRSLEVLSADLKNLKPVIFTGEKQICGPMKRWEPHWRQKNFQIFKLFEVQWSLIRLKYFLLIVKTIKIILWHNKKWIRALMMVLNEFNPEHP